MLSSGGLEQLDDPEIRRAVADYERRLNQAADATQRLNEYTEASLVPYYNEHANMPEMYDATGALGEFQFPPNDFAIDTSAFVGDRKFANLLASYLYLLVRSQGAGLSLLGSIEALGAMEGAS